MVRFFFKVLKIITYDNVCHKVDLVRLSARISKIFALNCIKKELKLKKL